MKFNYIGFRFQIALYSRIIDGLRSLKILVETTLLPATMNSFLKRVRNLARTIQSSSLEHQRAEAELRCAVEESLALLTPVDRIRIRSTLRYNRQKDRNMHALQRRLQEVRRLEARRRRETARLNRELRSLQAQERRIRARRLRLHDEHLEQLEALRERLRAYPASREDIEQLPSVAITSVRLHERNSRDRVESCHFYKVMH